MKNINIFKLISVVLATTLVSGCLPSAFFRDLGSIFQSADSDDSNTGKGTDIRIIPLRIPESGERLEIRDSETGEEYAVTVGEVYTSASGKHCGRYTVERENRAPESGLVCFEKQEEWIKVPLQLPVSN